MNQQKERTIKFFLLWVKPWGLQHFCYGIDCVEPEDGLLNDPDMFMEFLKEQIVV